jgi:hypothetical protein
MKPALRVLLGLGLTAGTVLAPAAPALAAGSGMTVLKPSAEAWYRTTPACLLPTGCAAAGETPSPYSPDTLHVGVTAGLEEARTYLQLDLAALPTATKPTGGTLLLPIAGGARDGTRAAATAQLQACAVSAPVQDADGSFAAPPEADCDAASVPATFVAATKDDPAAFTVDLSALTSAWETATPGAIALLPAADTAPPESWHVAFSDRTRTGEGVVPISASVAYASAVLGTAETEVFVAPPPFEPAPAFEAPAPAFDSGSFAAPPLSADVPLVPAPEPQAQPAPAPVAAPQQQSVVPVALTVPGGFRYPGVFLLPIVLAIAIAWLGRALTRDLATATA